MLKWVTVAIVGSAVMYVAYRLDNEICKADGGAYLEPVGRCLKADGSLLRPPRS